VRNVVRIIAILATVGGVLLAVPASAQNRIEWRLENPFRLFKDPKDTALHSQMFQSLSAGEHEAPILAAERKLEAQFGGRGWAEGVVDRTCYDQDGNRYSACPDYILPKSHRVVASFVKARRFWNFFQESSFEETCNWRFTDPAGKLLKEESGLCSRSVTYDVPYPEGGRLSVRTASGASPVPVDIKIRDILIVGLGDSFGAGEGNPDAAVKFDDDRDFNYGTVEIAATGRKEQLDGYPAREGKWRKIESREFQRERGPLARPRMPSLALFASAAGGPAAGGRKPAACHHLCRPCLQRRGNSARPVAAQAGAGMQARRQLRFARPIVPALRGAMPVGQPRHPNAGGDHQSHTRVAPPVRE
jgi:hypothetical protein